MFLIRNITFLRQHHYNLFRRIVQQYLYVCLKRSNQISLQFHISLLCSEKIATNNVDSIHGYLENIGGDIKKIEKEIKFSKVAKVNLELIVDVLQKLGGFEPMEIGQMISKRPRILLLDEKNVKSCFEMLRDIGLKSRDIAPMLKKSPGILTARIEETLMEKMEALYNLNVLPPFSKKDVLKIVKKCPALIATCTPASLHDKLHFFLNDLGFYRRQLRNMIMKQPSILTFSPDNIKAKFDYCFQDMGVNVAHIARCPRLWQCSLKRLKERHLYLRHLKLITDNTHIDDFGLGKIITPSDKTFAEEVAKQSFDNFQEFTKTL